MVGNKTCNRCQARKPRSDFYEHPTMADGYGNTCKSCISARNKERTGTGKPHAYAIQRTFGVTPEQYAEMLRMQGKVCFICGGVNANGKRLAIDHDHATDSIRKLLCSQCNVGLGSFRDNPELLRKAAEYVETHTQR